jgi:hypothetical protein
MHEDRELGRRRPGPALRQIDGLRGIGIHCHDVLLGRCFGATTTAQGGNAGRRYQLDARMVFDARKIELEREPSLDRSEQRLLQRDRRLAVGCLRRQFVSIDRRYGSNYKGSNAHECLDHVAHRQWST